MKKTITLSLCLLVLIGMMHAQDTIRIMTFNIDQGQDTTLQCLGEVIRSYHPDFVALQEVDMYPRRDYVRHQQNKNFIAELGFYTNMQGVFGKAWRHPGGWDYGDAILTKHSFSKSENKTLPYKSGMESRQIVMIHTMVNGHPVCFACTHLSFENKSLRKKQLRQIKHLMNLQKEKIKFICGDFNSDRSENIVFPTLKRWKDALDSETGTFTSKPGKYYKAYKYDYILYKNRRNIEVIYHAVECDEHLTDHCIGIADIVIH